MSRKICEEIDCERPASAQRHVCNHHLLTRRVTEQLGRGETCKHCGSSPHGSTPLRNGVCSPCKRWLKNHPGGDFQAYLSNRKPRPNMPGYKEPRALSDAMLARMRKTSYETWLYIMDRRERGIA